MSSTDAQKMVAVVSVIGLVSILYVGRNRSFDYNYRRVWGLVLLATGGAILADLAPAVVGPYFVLIALALLVSGRSGVGGLVNDASKAFSGK